MSLPSIEILDRLAINVLASIDHFLLEQQIVEYILETYTTFCRGDEACRLNILEKPITDEMRLRLRFECLCLCTFFSSFLSSRYFCEKKWFIKRPNQKLIELFDDALATALIGLCSETGMKTLREITLVSPKPTFKFGEHIDPLNRLEEYRFAHVKARGSESQRFGKWIGKTLDAPNYPLLEIIGGHFGKSLLHLSDCAITNVFTE